MDACTELLMSGIKALDSWKCVKGKAEMRDGQGRKKKEM